MSEKADSDLVRRQNRRIVLETLRQRGPLARIELGRHTGLSPASITSISAQLIEEGLIHALGEQGESLARHRRGRPQVQLALNADAALVLAVKISIDGVELQLANFRGETLQQLMMKISTYDAEPVEFGSTVAEEAKRFLIKARALRRVVWAGVAVQGLADTQTGSIVWSPAFRRRNIQIGSVFERELKVPCTVANDANMIAEGLISLDHHRSNGTTIVIFVGYGVGMGLIVNGVVYHGTTGGAAEFGHMNHIPRGPLCRCGRRGCIEAYAADYAIWREAKGIAESMSPPVSRIPEQFMLDLETAAHNGDGSARQAFAKAGEALGYGIARLIAVLSPDRVVIAGPATRAIALIEPSLRQAIEEGVVEEFRRNVVLEVVPIDTDMIIKGTIDRVLRHLDREVFAVGAQGDAMPVIRQAV